MAVSQAIRSRSRAQSHAPRQQSEAGTQQPAKAKSKTSSKKKKQRRRRRELPLLPPPVITRRGKTTIRRYSNRAFHRMKEVKNKIVDYVEFYTSGEYHSIDVRFQDKTELEFVISPGFLLEPKYID